MNKVQINNLLILIEKYIRSNNCDLAEKNLKKILEEYPENSKANELLAYVYGNQGNVALAHEHLIIACQNKNATPEAMYYLGISYIHLEKFRDAKQILVNALSKSGNFFEGLNALGLACANLGENEQALHYYEKASKLKNDSFELSYNLGKIFFNLRRYHEAIEQFDKSIQKRNDFGEAWHSKGAAHKELNQYEEALKSYDQAIKLNQNDYDSICNKSVVMLVMGNFYEGWKAYQYRWHQIPAEKYRYKNIKELDSLTDLKGKSVIVWWEQGFGDTIQFSRYISELLKITPHITFEVQEELFPLLKNQFKCKVVSSYRKNKIYDFQIPLLSTPKLLNTEINTIPGKNGYLKADKVKVEEWKKKLGLQKNKRNIGIAISGSSSHPNDIKRSMNFELLKPIAEVSNIFLIQKTLKPIEKALLSEYKNIQFLGDQINDFSDTAAIIENMDLIISVDTSLIHLAGAMGKTCYLMLPWVPEWRWLNDRNDSPWYSSMQIFRQPDEDNWKAVINNIKNKILENIE